MSRYSLAVTNLTGWPLDSTSRSGLTRLVGSQARSESSAVPGGVVSQSYLVEHEPWSLPISFNAHEVPGSVTPPLSTDQFDDLQRVATVEGVEMHVALDGPRVLGRAEVRVQPGSAFLEVSLADVTRVVGAWVGGRQVQPIATTLNQNQRRWLIPLGDENPSRAVFAWEQPALVSDQKEPNGGFAWLPRCGRDPVPASILVSTANEEVDLAILGDQGNRLTRTEAALVRLKRKSDEIHEILERANGGLTLADSEIIVERLEEIDLELRALKRSRQVMSSDVGLPIPTWQAIQNRAEAAVRVAGARVLVREARARTGAGPVFREINDYFPNAELPAWFRIRQVGRVVRFQVTTGKPGDRLRVLFRDQIP